MTSLGYKWKNSKLGLQMAPLSMWVLKNGSTEMQVALKEDSERNPPNGFFWEICLFVLFVKKDKWLDVRINPNSCAKTHERVRLKESDKEVLSKLEWE
jgi:hypothetical protein